MDCDKFVIIKNYIYSIYFGGFSSVYLMNNLFETFIFKSTGEILMKRSIELVIIFISTRYKLIK